MRRRNTEPVDSLELLLDTICNTFGGIVFLALLVCLLSFQSGRSAPSASVADEHVRQIEQHQQAQHILAKVDAAILRSRKAQADQRRAIEALGGRPDQQAVRDLTESEVQRRQLEDSIRDVTAQTAKLESARVAAEQQLREVEEQFRHAKADATSAEGELLAQRKKQTLHMRLPRARETTKRQVPVLLTGQRLCNVYEYDGDGRPTNLNVNDIRLDDGADRIRPSDLRAGGGLAVGDSDTFRKSLDQLLAVFVPQRDYIALAVWPDSYSEFRLVRDHVVRRGFEYELILLDNDAPIGFGPGGKGQVQ
jgi:hypothetical protein